MEQQFDNVTVVTNPLVQHHLTLMRDANTRSGRFRGHLKRLTRGLFYEAMAKLDVPIIEAEYTTPSGLQGKNDYIDSSNYALVAIMRTGVGMAGAVQDSLEEAIIGHAYYTKIAGTDEYEETAVRIPNLNNKFVFIFDSGMMSGGTALKVLKNIIVDHDVHPSRIAILTSIASDTAIKNINLAFDPKENPIPIFTAAIDSWNEGDDFATPGAGSMRQRLYGWPDKNKKVKA